MNNEVRKGDMGINTPQPGAKGPDGKLSDYTGGGMTLKDISLKIHLHAESMGWQINQEMQAGVCTGLKRNHDKYGKFYCPCKRVTGDPVADEDNVCPCVESETKVEADGMCHCHLFMKPGFQYEA